MCVSYSIDLCQSRIATPGRPASTVRCKHIKTYHIIPCASHLQAFFGIWAIWAKICSIGPTSDWIYPLATWGVFPSPAP